MPLARITDGSAVHWQAAKPDGSFSGGTLEVQEGSDLEDAFLEAQGKLEASGYTSGTLSALATVTFGAA